MPMDNLKGYGIINEYHFKKRSEPQNRYLNVLIDSSFTGINRLFVLSFESDDGRKRNKQLWK